MDETRSTSHRQAPSKAGQLPAAKGRPFQPLENIDARLMSLLEMAADSIVLMDAQSRILLYNKASEALFGYSAEEVIGKSVNLLMPPKYANHHDAYVDTYLETGKHSIIGIGREVQGKHKDGTVFPFDLSVGVAQTEEGQQFIGVMRDLRGRKKAEERLQNLQTELNQMTRINAMDEMGATVAHELNQPLTAIILYLQAIERKLSSGLKNPETKPLNLADIEKLIDLSQRAIQEAQRTASLLQRIRSIIEKEEPERILSDIVAVVRRAKQLAEVGFAASDIDIHLESEPGLPQLFIDPVQIEQVFLNLFRNAFQAMRAQDTKSIQIIFSRRSSEGGEKDRASKVRVSFKDCGPGIMDDQRASLFRAFSSDRRNGMGLGLAIARSIVQNHGGSMELAPYDPKAPGACFEITLPAISVKDGMAVPGSETNPALKHDEEGQDG
ncbi:MAG: PAS domain S-box protein [Cohaesibacter sp.]|jgi:two-component system sensor kinase FixL|nr:PAS domain S-box protein [Cohaesibacter sp.]